jgi:hypothetical protein
MTWPLHGYPKPRLIQHCHFSLVLIWPDCPFTHTCRIPSYKLYCVQKYGKYRVSKFYPESSKFHPVPEFIDPVFTKTSPKRSFSLNRKRAFWLVFVKTGSIISGTGVLVFNFTEVQGSLYTVNSFIFI